MLVEMHFDYKGRVKSVGLESSELLEFIVVENRRNVNSFESSARTIFVSELITNTLSQKNTTKVFYVGPNKYILSMLYKRLNDSDMARMIFIQNDAFSVESYFSILGKLYKMINPNVPTLVILDDSVEYFRDAYRKIRPVWSYYYVKLLEKMVTLALDFVKSKNSTLVMVRHVGHGEAIKVEYEPNLREQVLYELIPRRYVIRYNKNGITVRKLVSPSERQQILKWVKEIILSPSNPPKTPPGAPSSRGA